MKLSRSVAAVAAAGVLTVSACGSSADSLSDGGATTSAPTAEDTTEAPTEEAGGTDGEATESAGLTEATFLSDVTAAQLEAQTAEMEMEVDVAGQTLTMTGQVQGAESIEDSAMQARMEIPGGAGTVEMVLVDSVLYMRLGELTGGKYVRLSLDDPSAQQFLGDLQGQVNLAETTKALEGAVTGFEETGTDTVDGEETTTYELEVDTERFFAGQGGLAGLPPGTQLPDSLTYTFWIDDQDLPLRVTADMGSLGDLDMHFRNWGEPVDIQAPPPAQVTDENLLAPSA